MDNAEKRKKSSAKEKRTEKSTFFKKIVLLVPVFALHQVSKAKCSFEAPKSVL